MYKLAIIDDEPLIQLGLHSLVHYKELSLVPCEFVNTGNDALTLIREQKPDIVLLDISMPNLDGLDIISHIRQEGRHLPVFIILTNYDDFSYAQAAIRLDVSDFITKIEVNEEILNTALQKAILKVQEKTLPFSEKAPVPGNRSNYWNAKALFFDKLLNNFFSEQEIDLKEELAANGINGSLYGAAYFHLTGLCKEENTIRITLCSAELIEDCMKKYVSCYVTLWEADGIVCLFGLSGLPSDTRSTLDQALQYTSHMLHRYTNQKARIVVGPLCADPAELPDAFSKGRFLCRQPLPDSSPLYFSDFAQNDFPATDTEEFHLCEYRESLTNAFTAYDSQAITHILDQITQRYFRSECPLCSILSICFSLFYFTSVLIPNTDDFAPELFGEYLDPVESIRNIKDLEDAVRWIKALRDALASRANENLLRSKNWLIPSIMDYINSHSNQTLSLQEVADAFDKSPAYISTLFKKHCTVSFSEYVRSAKLTRAKQLLADGYKIKEVADMLGYSDPYYFSKLFKKAENMSPSEYIYSLNR